MTNCEWKNPNADKLELNYFVLVSCSLFRAFWMDLQEHSLDEGTDDQTRCEFRLAIWSNTLFRIAFKHKKFPKTIIVLFPFLILSAAFYLQRGLLQVDSMDIHSIDQSRFGIQKRSRSKLGSCRLDSPSKRASRWKRTIMAQWSSCRKTIP